MDVAKTSASFATTGPGVSLAGLTKRFGETTAVDDLNLEVANGALTTFLGPSGCGKTTTLRMVAGLETPTRGSIAVGGDFVHDENTNVPAERRQIGMVFQSYAVWPHMTVFGNVAFPLKVRRTARAEIESRTLSALKTVRLDHLAERYPAELSGGQQQRVALARAIVAEPRLLLFDEPLSNLDAQLREEMRNEIRELQQRLQITTLYVTHDQQEALAISDKVAVMHDGKVIQYDVPKTIYESPRTEFVARFVGWKNAIECIVRGGDAVEALGTTIKCDVPSVLQPGTPARLVARPEDTLVSEDTANADLIGTVRTSLYMGRNQVCEIELADGTVIEAEAHADQVVLQGQEIGIRLDSRSRRVLTE